MAARLPRLLRLLLLALLAAGPGGAAARRTISTAVSADPFARALLAADEGRATLLVPDGAGAAALWREATTFFDDGQPPEPSLRRIDLPADKEPVQLATSNHLVLIRFADGSLQCVDDVAIEYETCEPLMDAIAGRRAKAIYGTGFASGYLAVHFDDDSGCYYILNGVYNLENLASIHVSPSGGRVFLGKDGTVDAPGTPLSHTTHVQSVLVSGRTALALLRPEKSLVVVDSGAVGVRTIHTNATAVTLAEDSDFDIYVLLDDGSVQVLSRSEQPAAFHFANLTDITALANTKAIEGGVVALDSDGELYFSHDPRRSVGGVQELHEGYALTSDGLVVLDNIPYVLYGQVDRDTIEQVVLGNRFLLVIHTDGAVAALVADGGDDVREVVGNNTAGWRSWTSSAVSGIVDIVLADGSAVRLFSDEDVYVTQVPACRGSALPIDADLQDAATTVVASSGAFAVLSAAGAVFPFGHPTLGGSVADARLGADVVTIKSSGDGFWATKSDGQYVAWGGSCSDQFNAARRRGSVLQEFVQDGDLCAGLFDDGRLLLQVEDETVTYRSIEALHTERGDGGLKSAVALSGDGSVLQLTNCFSTQPEFLVAPSLSVDRATVAQVALSNYSSLLLFENGTAVSVYTNCNTYTLEVKQLFDPDGEPAALAKVECVHSHCIGLTTTGRTLLWDSQGDLARLSVIGPGPTEDVVEVMAAHRDTVFAARFANGTVVLWGTFKDYMYVHDVTQLGPCASGLCALTSEGTVHFAGIDNDLSIHQSLAAANAVWVTSSFVANDDAIALVREDGAVFMVDRPTKYTIADFANQNDFLNRGRPVKLVASRHSFWAIYADNTATVFGPESVGGLTCQFHGREGEPTNAPSPRPTASPAGEPTPRPSARPSSGPGRASERMSLVVAAALLYAAQFVR